MSVTVLCIDTPTITRCCNFLRYLTYPLRQRLLCSCSLQVERLSKSAVAKRAELQNLEAEASVKQARRVDMLIYVGWAMASVDIAWHVVERDSGSKYIAVP